MFRVRLGVSIWAQMGPIGPDWAHLEPICKRPRLEIPHLAPFEQRPWRNRLKRALNNPEKRIGLHIYALSQTACA